MSEKKEKGLVQKVKELSPDDPLAGLYLLMEKGEKELDDDLRRQKEEDATRVRNLLNERTKYLESKRKHEELLENILTGQKKWLMKLNGREAISEEAKTGLETLGKLAERIEQKIRDIEARVNELEKDPDVVAALAREVQAEVVRQAGEVAKRQEEEKNRLATERVRRQTAEKTALEEKIEGLELAMVNFLSSNQWATDMFLHNTSPDYDARHRELNGEKKRLDGEIYSLTQQQMKLEQAANKA
ncbi:MAG: hypothetical protein V1763_02385, partial [Parcubacteria group bacterium]